MINDFSCWSVYEGASEGSGRSEKEWLINHELEETGLFKFTKSEQTTEHISEKLAEDLACLIGIECAKIKIGKYRSRMGSLSLLINKKHEILIEGIYLINKMYPNYNPENMHDDDKQEYYSLEMILNSLDEYNLKYEFLKIIIFDFLIGNTDRHQNNWAVIRTENNLKMCPLYDNGSSLCCYIEEEKIDTYLGNDIVKFNSLVDSKSKSRIRINKYRRKEPTHLEVLKHIKQNYSEHVLHLINIIKEVINGQSLDNIFESYPDELFSKKRKQLVKLFLLEKVKLMKLTFFGEEE